MRFINSMSRGFKQWPVGAMKYKHTCTLESLIGIRSTFDSASKNWSNWSSTYLMTGFQHSELLTASPNPAKKKKTYHFQSKYCAVGRCLQQITEIKNHFNYLLFFIKYLEYPQPLESNWHLLQLTWLCGLPLLEFVPQWAFGLFGKCPWETWNWLTWIYPNQTLRQPST